MSGDPHPKESASLLQTIHRINASHDVSIRPLAQALSFAECMQMVGPVLIGAPLESSRPFVGGPVHSDLFPGNNLASSRPLKGFVAASSLLDPELFVIQRQKGKNVLFHLCQPAEWFMIVGGLGSLLVWLIGVLLIVVKRHWKRAAVRTPSSSTPL